MSRVCWINRMSDKQVISQEKLVMCVEQFIIMTITIKNNLSTPDKSEKNGQTLKSC